jgi:rod shape determining protein RodA
LDIVAGRVWADERRPTRHVDVALLVVSVALVVAGLFLLYSATNETLRADRLDPFSRVQRQAVTAVLGMVLLLLAASFDYRFLKVYAGFIYAGLLMALVLVRIPGLGSTDATGTAQRWFEISGFQVTPSEFMKLGLIVMLATLLSELRVSIPSGQDVVRLVGVAVVPVVLVFLQPDLGTAITLVAIVVGMLVVAGTRPLHLGVLAVTSVVLIMLAFQVGAIKEYQVDRLTTLFDPQNSSDSARYNLEQSLIAVGSGGMFGRGYLGGSQTSLDYVPEQHTDFIFTVVGEEFGFLGAIFVLGLYALLLWRAIRIAFLSKDPFGTYLAVGVASMFAIQMFVNVGMVIGIMPITGIPLPLLSYGGSSMLATFLAVGALETVHMRRFK